MQTKLKSLIAQGEGINIEFKEFKNKIDPNNFEPFPKNPTVRNT